MHGRDLLVGGQQRMAAHLLEEQRQRVGGRRGDLAVEVVRRRRLGPPAVVGEVDPAMARLVLDLALLMDLAHRAGFAGTQEWLSFYFKSPMTSKELYPEHDLFIQSMKLKNTMRWMMGEDLITHLGNEYYD